MVVAAVALSAAVALGACGGTTAEDAIGDGVESSLALVETSTAAGQASSLSETTSTLAKSSSSAVTSTSTTATSSSASSTVSSTIGSTTSPTTTTSITTDPPTTVAAAGSSTTVTGTPFTIGPAAGEAMAVVGVSHDDVLNFRTAPDAGAAVVATASPLSTSPTIVSNGSGVVTSAGDNWWNVKVDGTEAWANFGYLGALTGAKTSVLSQILIDMPGITAPDVESLAQNVAHVRSGGSGQPVVFSAEPVAVDAQGGEAVIDVIGVADASLKGERIWLSFQFVWDNSDPSNPVVAEVALSEALMMPICAKGVANSACI